MDATITMDLLFDKREAKFTLEGHPDREVPGKTTFYIPKTVYMYFYRSHDELAHGWKFGHAKLSGPIRKKNGEPGLNKAQEYWHDTILDRAPDYVRELIAEHMPKGDF